MTADYGEWLQRGVRVMPFIEDMAAAYAWADLVLCRAGALTVAELALAGLPSLLVPLPTAADDHQSANARALAETGAAIALDPRPLDDDALLTPSRDIEATLAALMERYGPDASVCVLPEGPQTVPHVRSG